MVGMRDSPQEVASYLRKVRKPMVEKQRRERMNKSIEQLKLLIADTIKQHMAPMSRVDKADILELTVFHLSRLQQQQRSVTMATDASTSYDNGFKDCAREAVHYVTSTTSSPSSGGTLASNLSGHLRSAYTTKSRRGVSTISGNRHSTPLQVRATDNSVNAGSGRSQFTASEYSPITPMTGKNYPYHESPMLHTTGSNSINDSDSGYSTSASSSSTESRFECSDSVPQTCDVIDVVTIGEGKENEIGHVITDNVWRPW